VSDLATSPIEPLGNRERNPAGEGRKERKHRPVVREKASGEEAEPLETIEAGKPHELDEMA
jgi:hypothetical protein